MQLLARRAGLSVRGAGAVAGRCARAQSEKARIEDLFAKNCFNDATIYQKIVDARLNPRDTIDADTADSVASAIFRWARDHGVTHYCHWFHPLTGMTAQKHDSFLIRNNDGTVISNFTGKSLIKSEPDASSFPSGGLRETHMARGYTVWDPNSPPFIMDSGQAAILYIPSVFFSWDGTTLDQKIPYLRASERLNHETLRLLGIIQQPYHNHVHTESGPEQEFFLIDRKYYEQRPDLKVCGRTLFGAPPPKGQELDDQYLGDMSYKALNCINGIEEEAWKLGIPVVTRHREVAPGQYELASLFDRSTISADQNVLIMEIINKVSKQHSLKALFHEKPFARVNGSGKHNNWSMGTDRIGSFFKAGDHPESNMTFMLFLAITVRAVHLHSDLLRLCVTGYGNDFRLGSSEAPPAIISMFLGNDLFHSIQRYLSGEVPPVSMPPLDTIDLGVHSLPPFRRETDDRNRTSPFAFTGNKFEFRAVGSSQPVSRSNLMLSTIMAESIQWTSQQLEGRLAQGQSVSESVRDVVKGILDQHSAIIFNGNNYSNEWKAEASRRGLPRFDTTPEALPQFTSTKNIQLFKSMNIMSETELSSRKSIFFDEYVKKVLVEGKMASYLTRRYVMPAVYRALPVYQGGAASASLGPACKGFFSAYAEETNATEEAFGGFSRVLDEAIERNRHQPPEEVSKLILSDLLPSMEQLRLHVDRLETMVDAKDWPLPTYHEMLFHQ